ncbi:hypothetical protein McanMca71_004128 [Microsporum canis]
MASRVLRLCVLLQALGSTQAFAPPWTVTKYFEASVTTFPGQTGRYGTYPASEYTETTAIVPTVSSPRATTTFTTSNYHDVTIIAIGLEPGQGTSSTYDFYTESQTYYIPLTYTYPSSCSVTSGESTITTSGQVTIPTDVRNQITPTQTSITTSTEEYRLTTYRYTNTGALLNPTDLPSAVYSSVEAENTPFEIRPKPREEQEELERNWKSMSFAAKFTLWLKYGFSRSYPPQLGTPPPLATDPLPTEQPQMAQQPPVPGVMPPLPQQTGPQPLSQQTNQQAEQNIDIRQQEQQPHSHLTEQQPGAPQREYEPLPVPAPYQPLPTVAHSSSNNNNNLLFEQSGQVISPVSGSGSPIPHQTELRESPAGTAEVPNGGPKAI